MASRAEFGPSGHMTKPDGLVIESYLEREPLRPDAEAPYKSIVEPGAVTRCLSAHSFVYRGRLPVDEDTRPVDPLKRMTRKPVVWARLRVNHYFSRSEEERRAKAELWRDVGGGRSVPTSPLDTRRSVRDEALVPYAPAVREALAQRGLLKRT